MQRLLLADGSVQSTGGADASRENQVPSSSALHDMRYLVLG